MSVPDAVNGLFEFCGGALNWLNVLALLRDKQVKGVHVEATMLFTAWGFWNLYYYPHLNQWLSFTGGVAIVGANLTWVILAIHYARPRL